MRSVFISYATPDRALVEPLMQFLAAAGVSSFFDRRSIEYGDR